MSDLEHALRVRLHDQLDGIEPSALMARSVVRRADRVRRRRIVAVGAAASALLVLSGAAAVALHDEPGRSESVTVAAALRERTRAYAEQFRDGDFATIREDMTPRVRAALPESTLRSVWRQALDSFGGLESIGAAGPDPADARTYLLRLQFRGGDANLRVSYDDDGRVIGITLLSAAVESLADVPPALADQARLIVANLAAERYSEVTARFDMRMREGLSTADLRSAWQQVAVVEHGGFVAADGLSAKRVPGATVVDVFCTMRRGELKVRIAFDQHAAISGLFLLEP